MSALLHDNFRQCPTNLRSGGDGPTPRLIPRAPIPIPIATGWGFTMGHCAGSMYPRFGHILGPYLGGASIGMAWWIWDGPPEHIARWKGGAE
jgi:hypothetical protein